MFRWWCCPEVGRAGKGTHSEREPPECLAHPAFPSVQSSRFRRGGGQSGRLDPLSGLLVSDHDNGFQCAVPQFTVSQHAVLVKQGEGSRTNQVLLSSKSLRRIGSPAAEFPMLFRALIRTSRSGESFPPVESPDRRHRRQGQTPIPAHMELR